jgi:hypothetical protein
MMVMNVLFVFIALFVLYLTFELMLETLEGYCVRFFCYIKILIASVTRDGLYRLELHWVWNYDHERDLEYPDCSVFNRVLLL